VRFEVALLLVIAGSGLLLGAAITLWYALHAGDEEPYRAEADQAIALTKPPEPRNPYRSVDRG
jgi:hypothetical protein